MKKTTLFKSMLLLCALVVGSGSVWAQKSFKLIKSTDELVAGCNYLIVTQEFSNASDPIVEKSYYSIGTKNSSTNRKAPQVTITNGVITTTIGADGNATDPRMFNLRASTVSGRWIFYNDAESGYLNGGYNNGSKNQNQIKIETELSTNTSTSGADGNYNITIDNEGNATITNQTDFSIFFNANFTGKKGSKAFSNPLISTYPSSSTQYTGVSLYREVVPVTFATGKTMISFSNANYALDLTTANLPTGLAAYKVSAANEHSVTLTAINSIVTKNTGVILTGTASTTYNIPVVATGTDISASNLLVASDGTSNVTDAYVLSDGKFHPVQAAGLVIPAGKAYLNASSLEGRVLDIVFDEGGTTGVQELKNSSIEDLKSFYDLQGRRVAQPTKGLYIVNGKKVIIK